MSDSESSTNCGCAPMPETDTSSNSPPITETGTTNDSPPETGTPTKCPSMPETDTSGCIPQFLKWPKQLTPQYKGPEGVEIVPIGVSGRTSNKRPDFNKNPASCEDFPGGCKNCISDKETGIATESATPLTDESGESSSTENFCDASIANKTTQQCKESMDPATTIRSLLQFGCDCSLCAKPVPESEDGPSLIPELDSNDSEPIEVKADWLMQTPCGCTKCIPKGQASQSGSNEEECFFPTLTCGECGTTRGQNPSCLMCCFSCEMEHERKLLDYTCTACGTLTDDCKAGGKDPCVKAKVRGIDEFDYDCDGKPIYEGGMSIERMQHYLWKHGESYGPNGFEQLAYIECDDDGCEKPEEEDRNCNCKEFERLLALQSQDHRVNGMTLQDYIYYIPFWSSKDPARVCEPKKIEKKGKINTNKLC